MDLKSYWPCGSTGKRGRNAHNRLFIDVLLWMAHSGGVGRYDKSGQNHRGFVKLAAIEISLK